MSKRMWVLLLFAFVVTLFYGGNHMVITAETAKEELDANCQKINGEVEEELEEILDILNQNDMEGLKDRINPLLDGTTEALEAEKELLEASACIEEVAYDEELYAKVNGYHSLIIYGMQMKDEGEIQFDTITFDIPTEDRILQVEGTLQDSATVVYIEHFYDLRPGQNYFEREYILEKEKLKQISAGPPPIMLTIINGLASNSYAVIQNPIEKFILMVNDFFTDKMELEEEIFEKEAALNSSYFNVQFSLITSEEGRWNHRRIDEYYPSPRMNFSRTTYRTIERAQEVHEEFPEYWYPKEEIERGDWNGVVDFYEEHQADMRRDGADYALYEYIFGDMLIDSEDFDELIKHVKENRWD